jgi:hypothetical protein
LLIPSWFNHHNTQTPNTNKVKITAFTADMSWNIPVGVTMAITFNVTVQNIGTNDIDGVNITLERIINKTESLIGSYFYSNENSTYFYENGNLGVLHSGEIRKIRVDFFTSLDHYAEVTSSNFLASLKWNGTVLDERKLF